MVDTQDEDLSRWRNIGGEVYTPTRHVPILRAISPLKLRNAKIRHLHEQGVDHTLIAERYGVGSGYVLEILRRG
jgi:hypothetical protein